MSTAWVLLALLGPPLAALIAGIALSPRDPHPGLVVALNTLSPGAGLAAAGRPTIEAVLGVLMAQTSLLIAGSVGSPGAYVPFMVIGGVWAAAHTPYSPFNLTENVR